MLGINNGGPAFPLAEPGNCVSASEGMTLRDYFATHCVGLDADCPIGLATQLAATQGVEKPIDNKDVMGWHRFWCAVHATHRYMMADAMIAARKPEYDPTRMASQALDDRATIAGLESAVSHLSALFDEFRALLVEVDGVCGRDGHGGQLEDGESEIIDKVRAALSMTEASAMLDDRDKP